VEGRDQRAVKGNRRLYEGGKGWGRSESNPGSKKNCKREKAVNHHGLLRGKKAYEGAGSLRARQARGQEKKEEETIAVSTYWNNSHCKVSGKNLGTGVKSTRIRGDLSRGTKKNILSIFFKGWVNPAEEKQSKSEREKES